MAEVECQGQQDRGRGLQGTWREREESEWQISVLLGQASSSRVLWRWLSHAAPEVSLCTACLDASRLFLAPCHPGSCLLR